MTGAIFISDDLVLLSFSDDPEFDVNSKPCCRAVMKAKCCNTPITAIMGWAHEIRRIPTQHTFFCFVGFSMSSRWGIYDLKYKRCIFMGWKALPAPQLLGHWARAPIASKKNQIQRRNVWLFKICRTSDVKMNPKSKNFSRAPKAWHSTKQWKTQNIDRSQSHWDKTYRSGVVDTPEIVIWLLYQHLRC